ncbi:MAG: hydrolase [Gammaproteobacteria bacterium RIFCSPHIGHO2_12_FULL_37_34]|nr:MAG: hydrolase [Gammaproteobacteria bacterium RIFCSPHIGHO2_12_FULL_37_34]
MNQFAIDNDYSTIIPCGDIHLDGILHVPKRATSIVLFVHGSGSSRFSSRNQFIANILQQANIATLLFDLLTSEEDKIDEHTREYRFNIELLATRLLAATNWILTQSLLQKLLIGYFGASTGGGAALLAAAQEQNLIQAIVSRGGRPDLAGPALQQVKAATLLLVGGDDESVIAFNQQAFKALQCMKELTIIPGATHLFEEPGKLAVVAQLAKEWFERYLIQRL